MIWRRAEFQKPNHASGKCCGIDVRSGVENRDSLHPDDNALSATVRKSGVVFFVQHTDTAEGLEKGSANWQLSPELVRAPADLLMEKSACDAFLETNLDEMLRQRGITELIIVGCATDFCVDTTVRSAAAHGYEVTVASDGHTTRDRPHLSAAKIIEHHHYMWTDLLLPSQRKIRVADTATLVSELNKRARA